jgi:hypothetical protein
MKGCLVLNFWKDVLQKATNLRNIHKSVGVLCTVWQRNPFKRKDSFVRLLFLLFSEQTFALA